MKKDDIDEIKTRFKQIVYLKGKITESNSYISTLSRFDRNNSHKKAILKAIDKKKEIQRDYNALLDGYSYDEWKQIRKDISRIESRIKQAKTNVSKLELLLINKEFNITKNIKTNEIPKD